MTLIDDQTPDPKQVPFRPVAQRYGLIWGAASIVIGLIGYLTGMDPQLPDTSIAVKVVFGLVGLAVPIWAVVTAVKHHRDNELGGFITVGRGLGIGTFAGLVAGILGAIWMLVFLYGIAPEYIETLKDSMVATWESQGMDEEAIEMALKFSSFTMNPIFMAISQIIGGTLFGLIIGLIVGLIMKRDRPA